MMTSPLPLLRRGCPLLALALLAVGACLLLSRPSAADAPPPTIKNVIIFIGDGMGFNQVLAADYYQYGAAAGATSPLASAPNFCSAPPPPNNIRCCAR